MFLNLYFINDFPLQGGKKPALAAALSCLTSRLFHTAPHLSVGKLHTTQINVDILLCSATNINYKTAKSINVEVMQLHCTFLLCTRYYYFCP